MKQKTNSLCVLPWFHSYIGIHSDIQLCCNAKSAILPRQLNNTKLKNMIESRYMDHIRNQMIRGHWPSECVSCQQSELYGLGSHRQGSNHRYNALYQKLLSSPEQIKPKLKSIDLRISNKCNYKCRTCSGHLSSAWRDEHLIIYGNDLPQANAKYGVNEISIKANNVFWDNFEKFAVTELEELNFAGGESLLLDRHYNIIEQLITAKKYNTSLIYTTNLSILKYKQWDLLYLWSKFSNITLHLSLDGVGERGEYIRKGLNWKKWLENVTFVKNKLPHIKIDMHFVVSIFNIIHIEQHINGIIDNELIDLSSNGDYKVAFTPLEQPEYLSIQNLSMKLKNKVKQNIEFMVSNNPRVNNSLKNSLKGLLTHMYAQEFPLPYKKEFKDKTILLDKSRKQNYLALFPELQDM